MAGEITSSKLNDALGSFPARLNEALTNNEFLDVQLARTVHRDCIRLLAACDVHLPRDSVPYVLAAVDYFINRHDGAPDFKAIDGFEDDAAVIEAVISDCEIDLKKSLGNDLKEPA